MFGGAISENVLMRIAERMTDKRFNVFGGEFSIEDMTSYVATDLLAHNRRKAEYISSFCRVTNKRDWGGWLDTSLPAEFEEVTEGRNVNMVTAKFATVRMSAPWKRAGTAYGYTREAKLLLSGVELQKRMDNIKKGDSMRLSVNIARRLLVPTTFDFRDEETDKMDGKSYGLANGDSMPYPSGSYGQGISNHTHYFGITGASLADGDLTRLTEGMIEHAASEVEIRIHWNDLSRFTALGASFSPVLQVGQIDNRNAIITLDSERISPTDKFKNDRKKVGTWNSIPVYASRDYFPGYGVCMPVNQSEDEKPLAYRVYVPEDEESLSAGLNFLGETIVGNDVVTGVGDLTPITALPTRNYQFFEVTSLYRGFGVGGSNRLGATVLSFTNSVSNAYLVPTNLYALIQPQ
jgi:hypothetical protein